MAIALPGPERLPPGSHREFVQALHQLYDTAGQPGARVISVGIRRDLDLPETVSHETVTSLLSGKSVPAWAKVKSVIVALSRESVREYDQAALLERFQVLWLAARTSGAASVEEDNGRPDNPVDDLESEHPSTSPAVGPDDRRPGRPDPPERAAKRPAREPVGPPRKPPRPAGAVVGELPSRNPSFTGREILLDRMRDLLEEHPYSPLVLYGVAGVGKTQLAREYLDRNARFYSVVWWIPADRAEGARSSLVELAERLQIPTQRGAQQTIDALLAQLGSEGSPYVLVFDGVEDEEIQRLTPTIGGHVILTTRNPALANEPSNTDLEVGDFDRAEAIQFLRRGDDQLQRDQADRLTEVVGRLPLALELIAALHRATGLPWDTLRARLEEPRGGLLAAGKPAHYPDTVAATLQLALEQLREANPVAAVVFELFAWFGSESVSIALLRAGQEGDVSHLLDRTLKNQVELARVTAFISRFGLARLSSNQRIEVPPLIRLVLHDVLSEQALARAQRNVHQILAAADPGGPDDLPSVDMHREMAAHVIPSDMIHSNVEAAHTAVLHQIRYRYVEGDFEGAGRLGQAAVTAWRAEDFLGPDHELVLLATREWANALRATGRYDRSRELTEEAMSRLRQLPHFGDDHPDTLAMATSLAAEKRIAGHYQEAQRIDEENHRRHLARYGPENRRTASSHHNLAVSLRHVGDFGRALEVDEAELSRHRDASGDESVRTLRSANACAEDLYGLGRYREALDLQVRYLQGCRPRLGPTHRDILLGERTAALARRALGEIAGAVDLSRSHYEGCVTSFGGDHEFTLAAIITLVNALRRRGYADEAHPYAAEAVSSYRRILGQRNPLTLAAEINLAAVQRARDWASRARRTDSRARDALLANVGPRHPYAITASINLATDLWRAHDQAGALALSEEAYLLAGEVRGAHHPDTLAAGANLAMDRRAAGAPDTAEDLQDEVLAVLRRTLGPDHPMVDDIASGLRVEVDIEPPSM